LLASYSRFAVGFPLQLPLEPQGDIDQRQESRDFHQRPDDGGESLSRSNSENPTATAMASSKLFPEA